MSFFHLEQFFFDKRTVIFQKNNSSKYIHIEQFCFCPELFYFRIELFRFVLVWYYSLFAWKSSIFTENYSLFPQNSSFPPWNYSVFPSNYHHNPSMWCRAMARTSFSAIKISGSSVQLREHSFSREADMYVSVFVFRTSKVFMF